MSNPRPTPIRTEFNNPNDSRNAIILAMSTLLTQVNKMTMLPKAIKGKSIAGPFKMLSATAAVTMHTDAMLIGKINRRTSFGVTALNRGQEAQL